MQCDETARVRIDADDYETLLALGYPPGDEWSIGDRYGDVNLKCPFTGHFVSVARLVSGCNRRQIPVFQDDDRLNLTRENMSIVRRGIPGSRRHQMSLKAAKAHSLATARVG